VIGEFKQPVKREKLSLTAGCPRRSVSWGSAKVGRAGMLIDATDGTRQAVGLSWQQKVLPRKEP
jgi:hypothetical protein